MTFKELFEASISKVANQQYEGRTAAIDALVYHSLQDAFKNEVEKSHWSSCLCSNPYGKDDPYLEVFDHGCHREIKFKVRLKTAGKKHHYYGDCTYYTPVLAFLANEEMMDMEIVDVLNKMHDEADDVKLQIAKEQEIAKVKAEHKDLVDRLTSVTNEFNELPVEIRRILYNDIPQISYYSVD